MTHGFKILICGSRQFHDYEKLKEIADNHVSKIQYEKGLRISDFELVSGNANGADRLGERWAGSYGMNIKTFIPDWKNIDVPNANVKENAYGKYNANAGHIRNQQMGDYAFENELGAFVIAFYKGESRGSKMMVRIIKKMGIPYIIWDDDKGKERK